MKLKHTFDNKEEGKAIRTNMDNVLYFTNMNSDDLEASK